MSIIRFTTPQATRWSRYDRLSSLRDLFDSAVQLAGHTQSRSAGLVPALDVFEDEEKVTVQIELAGMKKEDFDLSLDGDVLTVSGERKSQSNAGTDSRRERVFGAFRRAITLPSSVKSEQVAASYQDGILTVTLPKAEEAKPRKIQVELN